MLPLSSLWGACLVLNTVSVHYRHFDSYRMNNVESILKNKMWHLRAKSRSVLFSWAALFHTPEWLYVTFTYLDMSGYSVQKEKKLVKGRWNYLKGISEVLPMCTLKYLWRSLWEARIWILSNFRTIGFFNNLKVIHPLVLTYYPINQADASSFRTFNF